jgi:hypothetical protein
MISRANFWKRVAVLVAAGVLVSGGTAEALPRQAHRLGDFVWLDANRNGRQDPGENGVPGVIAILRDRDGSPIRTPVVTDSDGRYLFDGLADGRYRVCFDLSAVPAAYAGAKWTVAKAGPDPAKDSDADPSGCVGTVVLGAAKADLLTIDAGIVLPLNKIGDFVWADTNSDGRQGGEHGVAGVFAFLQNGAGAQLGKPVLTDAQGRYNFDGLADGTYRVCFSLPAGTKWTVAQAGTDLADDSDVTNGCTPTTVLGAANRVDSTLDAGLERINAGA